MSIGTWPFFSRILAFGSAMKLPRPRELETSLSSLALLAALLVPLAPLGCGGPSDPGQSTDDDDDDDDASASDDDDDDSSVSDDDDDSTDDDDDETATGDDDDDATDDDDDDDATDTDDEDDDDDDDATNSDESGDDSVEDPNGPLLIDNLEDGDGNIADTDNEGRQGYWYVRTDGSGGSVEPAEGTDFSPAEGGALDSKYHAQLKGKGFKKWGAKMGLFFDAESGKTPKSYETKHTGVRFAAKGKGSVFVAYGTAGIATTEDGGTCTASGDLCQDVHGKTFTLGDEWSSYTLYFADPDVHQNAYGPGVELDPGQSIFFEFRTTEDSANDFEIHVDNIAFVDDEPDFCENRHRTFTRTFAVNRPFPQNADSHAIKPNHRCEEDLVADIVAEYEFWKENFLREGHGGYYIEMQGNCGGADTITTSEAQGYGMILTALMAGYDPDAETIFQGLLDFAKNNQSNITPGLMNGCVSVPGADGNTATDGDLDIAYALLLADAQFGGYADDAQRWIELQESERIIRSNGRPSLGDWDSDSYDTRPSDWMYDHFRIFAKYGDAQRWNNALDTCYELADEIVSNFASSTGLQPDFVVNDPPEPAEPFFLEGEHDGNYSYNACRVPLRLAVDFGHNNESRAKDLLSKLVTWAVEESMNNPALFMAGYTLDGKVVDGVDYADIAFVGPLTAGAAYSPDNQYFVNYGWGLMTGAVGDFHEERDYFSQSLSLMSMLFLTGNWWSPE
jgi:endoglucanase